MITKVVLVHCNIANNDYQQDPKVLYTFFPNKLFRALLEISPTNHIFLKSFKSEFQTISQPLEVEDKTNLALITR